MAKDPDEDRIRRKAHELWIAEGHPHGRDQDHWVQAREIIAIQDSQGDTLLPRDTGAEEPIEEADEALRNMADFPNLTDQGENLLTSTDREPEGMASVEVPTSGQPGIPAAPTKQTSAKGLSKPAQPVAASPMAAAQPKTAKFPKVAAPDAGKTAKSPPSKKN